MKEKLTKYLKALSVNSNIGRQYLAEADEPVHDYTDPLMEDRHEMVKGLIHKFDNRALIKTSYKCAAHCRFCTRIRQIGTDAGTLNGQDIDNIIAYLKNNPQIDDVILSGGDPFYTPLITQQLLTLLNEIDSIKVLRIGTRMPLQSPASFDTQTLKNLLSLIDTIGQQKPFFILLHVEHPDELTPEVLELIRSLRQYRVTLLSQTVFLKGINDDEETLYDLFRNLYHAGVIPYYLYHCDSVKGLEHFVVGTDSETAIATALRKRLSGIACPTYVMDIEHGYGKVPVPLAFFSEDMARVTDFRGQEITVKRLV